MRSTEQAHQAGSEAVAEVDMVDLEGLALVRRALLVAVDTRVLDLEAHDEDRTDTSSNFTFSIHSLPTLLLFPSTCCGDNRIAASPHHFLPLCSFTASSTHPAVTFATLLLCSGNNPNVCGAPS